MSDPELNVSRGSIGRALAVVVRVCGWGVLGAVCGIFIGFANGVIHAPPDVPGDPLANEWYTPGVILIMFVECLAGFLIGSLIAVGVGTPSSRRKAFIFALGGAVLGVGLGWVLARIFHVLLINWHGGSELVSNLVLQAAGAIGGIFFAATLPSGSLKSPTTDM